MAEIKILIVSNQQDLQDSLKELVPDCDQISTYTSVEKIITLFKQELYNLVILDLLFIGENTPQLILQILASSGSNKSIIWGLADQNNLESIEEALNVGAHDYLSWPLDTKSLKLKCLVAKKQLSSLIEETWHNESRLKHFKTDLSLDVETTTTTRYDPITNVPLSLATATHNIVEHKRAEEVLRASQQELSIIYENVTSMIFYLTVEADDMFRFVSVNPAFLQVTGLEKEQVIGKLVQEVVPQLPLELVLSRYREAIQTKQPIKWEEVRVFSTGTKYGEVTATPVCDVDGKVTHIIGIVHDITEHKRAEESLRLSEEKFSSLMYYSPIGKTIVASDGHLLEINPAFSKIIGYTKEELLAIDFQTITHPDDLQISLYYFSKLLNREVESYQLEKRYIHKDGHIIWAELNTSMVWNIDGTPRYCFSQIQDITERKQAKEALLLSKKKLLLAMDMAKLGYWEFDVDTQMITFDENLFKVYGRNVAEEGSFLIPIVDYAERFIPEKEIFIFIEEFAKAQATNNPNFSREFEHRIIKADGSTGYVLVRYAIVKDAQGHTVKTYGIVQDITARKIAEATLEQQRHQSNAIIKSASDGIISIDENQQILVFNPAAEKIFGCLSKEALGQPIDQFIPMRYRTNHKNLIEQFGETGISNRAMGEFREVCGLRKNGEEFAMEASISQSELAGHKLFTVTCRDVTERNQAQEALRESEERYRVIIEGAKEGIIFVEIDLFRFVYVNSSLCRMFGYSTEEFLKLLPADLTDEKSALRALGEAKALVKGEKTSILEIPCRRKDGKIFYVEVSASSLKLKGKDYVVGFITDVTKRRQAAAEQARLVSILEASPLFVGSANLDGSIMYLNKSLLKLFDIKADSNLSRYNIRDVHPT